PPRSKEDVKKLFDFYLSKVSVDPEIWNGDGLKPEAFDEIWNSIKNRKLLYEATIQSRNIKVSDEYWITPRDVKNIVQEAASDVAFEGRDYVTLDKLIEYVKGLSSEKHYQMSVL
ncbi:MAG: hypothetical protein DRJ60_07970, partial [Thermoprotei archaeon]